MLERVLAIVTADDVEAGSAEALVEDLRDSFADPVQIGLAGAVVEGQHEEQAVMDLRGQGGGFCSGLVFCLRRRCEEDAEQGKSRKREAESAVDEVAARSSDYSAVCRAVSREMTIG